MRRAAVAVMVGCAFGGIGSGVGHQHEISEVRLTAAIQSVTTKTAAMTAKAAAPAMKTVEYGGYAIRVPASWPVYLLSKDPGQCVRYDVNAVYLGTPGRNQNCPPHLVGRADTVSIGGPVTLGEPSTPVQTDLRAAVGAKRAGTDLPAKPGTIWKARSCASSRWPCPAAPRPSPPPTGRARPYPAVAGRPDRIEPQSGAVNSAPWPGTATVSAAPQASDPPRSSHPDPGWIASGLEATRPARRPGDPTHPARRTGPDARLRRLPPARLLAPLRAVSRASSPAPSSPPPAPGGPLAGLTPAPPLRCRHDGLAGQIRLGGDLHRRQEMGCDYGNLSRAGFRRPRAWAGPNADLRRAAGPCNSFSDEINRTRRPRKGSKPPAGRRARGVGGRDRRSTRMEGYNETRPA